jgi:protein-histidine pros-kinase
MTDDPLARLKMIGSSLTNPELVVRLLDKLPDALVVVGRAGEIVLVNERAELLFGYHRTELIGEGIEMLVPEALRDAHRGHRKEYMHSPRARPMGAGLKLHAVRKCGREVPVEISLAPLQTTEGLYVSAVIRETPER